MLRWLEAERRRIEHTIGHRPIGVAACEVLDGLIGRTRVLADAVPANAPMTIGLIEGHFSDLADTLTVVATTLRNLADLTTAGGGAVEDRRQPFLRLIARVESEGYAVADNLAVTDTTDYSTLQSNGDPATQVQLAAEKITRTEQTTIYQHRIERMARAIAETEHTYAERIRDLIDQTA